MKKLPIIRHLRYFYLKARLNAHVNHSAKFGFFPIPQREDLDYLRDVWEGKK